ncbi:rod shape-determining protein MreD [Ruminiclostridium cellulolyticum]|uniref:Rod shape-determining protein MreD n=1 Tax=Ruminiclostridium cellulolyticum (strain ATCC 35319 / DSM 5812 / JCM 6584 / H10) TaxID=394503 RepID=B8I6C4_RUMCH|nr:rod shape-determining protein MreD [Ruminiclostridium cellulolyticum]ACL76889.1 rod shape-determining protein MreD [Ruminiclostridium cellulolyticum H10]
MRNKVILYAILIFIFVTAQVTLLNSITIFGVAPNLVIILIVSISLLKGKTDGAVVGFSAGLCMDAVIGVALGYHALVGMLLGLLLGNINKRLFKENILVMAFCTFLSTYIFESAILFTSYLMGLKVEFFTILKTVIFPESLVNCVLGVIVFLVIILLNRGFLENEEKNRY